MAVTSWRFPGTTASVSPGDEVWSNPGNIVSDNASYASSTAVGAGGTTETLKATNFGFVSGDFPAGWTITGLEVEIERYAFDNGCTTRDSVVQFYDASGTLTGSNFADTATNYPASATIKAYGGAGNMLGTSLTASDLQDADFGVALKCVGNGGTGSDYSQPLVDYIRVRAHLTPPPSGYSIVGIGTVAGTTVSGGNLTLAEPAGVQEGDLLVAVISYRSNASFANTGSIWTKQEEENSGNTTANSTGSIGSGVAFWGIRGSSAPDLTFERTGGNVARGCIIAYRPDNAGDTFEIDTSTSLTRASASTSFTMSGFTPAQDATLLVWCGFGARNTTLSAFDAATDPTTASGTTTDTTTDPYFDTWLRRVTSGTSTGADCTIAIADAVQETATATGNFTYTAGSSARHAGAVLAFRLVAAAGDVTATPGAGSLTLTGQAPSVSASASVSPGVASLTITGYAPTVSAGSDATAAPGAGSLALTGLAPTVSASASVAPAAGAVVITGQSPTVAASASVSPAAANLTLTGQAPTVAASSTATPGVGGLTLAGNAPTVTASAVVSPTPGAVVITGYAPAVSASVAASPAIAELVLTGHAPTVTASSGAVDVTAAPDTGALVINGYAPDVTVTSAPAETGNSIIPSQRWTRGTGGMVPSREALELTSTDEWKRLLRQAEEAEAAVETLAPALPAKMVAKAARLAEALPDLAAVEAIAAAQTAAATVPLVTASAIRKARALIALAIEAERIAAEQAEDDDITAILLLAA